MNHPNISLTSGPSDCIESAYNCINYKFDVDDLVLVQSSIARVIIEFSSTVNNSETLTIFGQTFLFTSIPNNNSKLITISSNISQLRDNVIEAFSINYEISKYFIVSSDSSNRILLEARQNGPQYNINPLTNSTAINFIETISNDIIANLNYKVVASIQKYIDNNWQIVEEIVRDVVPYTKQDGTLSGCVNYNLSFLKFSNKRSNPILSSSIPFIDQDALSKFRLQITDFKNNPITSGTLSTLEPISILMGGYNWFDTNKLIPYHEDSDTFFKTMNFMAKFMTLCCDNHLFINILVCDKEDTGWNLRAVGNKYFDDGTIENGITYISISGVGSSVVTLPLGPSQLNICEENGGLINSYDFRATLIQNTSLIDNLFIDGDNGQFETGISGILTLANVALSQSTISNTGDFSLSIARLFNANIQPSGDFIIWGQTAITFDPSFFYELDCWIRLPDTFNCNCINNLFIDGDSGTFENNLGNISLANNLSITQGDGISPNTNSGRIINFANFNSLLFGGLLLSGSTNILFDSPQYTLEAFLKIENFDCRCFDNLFVDGGFGDFEGTLLGIQTPVGTSISIDSGTTGLNNDGLLVERYDLSNIQNGDFLMNGSSFINFLAGQTYTLRGFVRSDQIDCNCIGTNLFIDGDNGTFDSNIDDIASDWGPNISYSNPNDGVSGSFLRMIFQSGGTISNGDYIANGDSSFSINSGITYNASCYVKLDRILYNNLVNNLFIDGDNGTFSSNLLGIQTSADQVNSLTLLPTEALLFDLNFNSAQAGDMLIYGNSTINLLSGTTYKIISKVLIDGLGNSGCEGGCNNSSTLDIIFSMGIESGFNDATITTTKIWDSSSSCIGDYVTIESEITINSITSGKIGIVLSGTDVASCASSVVGIVDNIAVFTGNMNEIDLSVQPKSLPTGVSVNIISNQTVSSDDENVWLFLESEIISTVNTNINLGVVVGNNPQGIGVNTEFSLDEIRIIDISGSLSLQMDILANIVGSGSLTTNQIADYSIDCSNKNQQWILIESEFICTSNISARVGVKSIGNVSCIKTNQYQFRADGIEVISSSQQGITFSLGSNVNSFFLTESVVQSVTLNGNCNNQDIWLPLKTNLNLNVPSISGSVGLKVTGNTSCLNQSNLSLFIDELTLTDGTQSNIEFSIGLLNNNVNQLQTLTLNDGCDNTGNWVNLKSIITPSIQITDNVGVFVSGATDCLQLSSLQGPILIDDITVKCYDGVGALISEEYTINLNKAECKSCCNTEFIFVNQLGVYDSIYLDCLYEGDIEVNFDENTLCQSCISIENGKTVISNITAEKKYKIVSELNPNQKDLLEQFAKSNKRFIVFNGNLIPIIPISKDIRLFDINNNTKLLLEFEYVFASDEITLVR